MEETIAAISTPVGEGGIGIVRLSGEEAFDIADRIFLSADKRKVPAFKSHTVHYGYIVKRRSRREGKPGGRRGGKIKEVRQKDIIDEVLLTVMRAPRTYTREDIVEINCHGGVMALRKVLDLAVKNGARVAEPGEFTKRAFLNGRIDLAQAEAVLDIIKAKTETGLRASMHQLGGALSAELDSIRESLLSVCAQIEACIDFPDYVERDEPRVWFKNLRFVSKRLKSLSDNYYKAEIIKEGAVAVICGRANVGKSSLMNVLLRKDRVIVTHIPGTTRDAIEELINIGGLPVRLVDTAGFRNQRGVAEKAGMDKSRQYMERADLILCVIDGSERLTREDKKLIRSLRERPAIIAVNKCDLKPKQKIETVKRLAGKNKTIKISCLRQQGIDRLEKKIYNEIIGGKLSSSGEILLGNIRQKAAVEKALEALDRAARGIKNEVAPELAALDTREAIDCLGEIVGKVYTDDILGTIFSRFCIGK